MSIATLQRLFARTGSRATSEQEDPDDPKRLVFIDDAWPTTGGFAAAGRGCAFMNDAFALAPCRLIG